MNHSDGEQIERKKLIILDYFKVLWDITMKFYQLLNSRDYNFLPNLMDPALKISLSCPWQIKTSQLLGRHIFWATTYKFGENSQLLHVHNWQNFETDSFSCFKCRKIYMRSSLHLYQNSMIKSMMKSGPVWFQLTLRREFRE